MLLVWAKAWVFAHLNQIPLLVSSWDRLRLGPFLRREQQKRLYIGHFKRSEPMGSFRRAAALCLYQRVTEPAVARVRNIAGRTLYVFNRIPHWSDYFKGLREHRDAIRSALYSMLSPGSQSDVKRMKAPVIGIHVRLGDFRKLAPGQDFAKVGNTRTPQPYFRSMIEGIRRVHGNVLPVTLFSDGQDDELRELLSLPNVHRAPMGSAIVDILTMSQSRIVIPSASSTFGYWAAFLSDAAVILHPDHLHAPIRGPQQNRAWFEGIAADEPENWPALLKENIRAIRTTVDMAFPAEAGHA